MIRCPRRLQGSVEGPGYRQWPYRSSGKKIWKFGWHWIVSHWKWQSGWLLRWLSLALQYTLMLSKDDEKQMAHVCFFNGRRSSTAGIRTWLLMVASPREVLLRKAGLAVVGLLRHGVWKAGSPNSLGLWQIHDTINCHSVLPNGHFRSVMVKNHA